MHNRILPIVILLFLLAVGCREKATQGFNPWLYLYEEEDTIDLGEEEVGASSESQQNVRTIVTDRTSRLADLGKRVYTDLIQLESDVIGGTKLCAEMSSDREGCFRSVVPQNTTVNFYPPHEIGLVSLVPSHDMESTNIFGRYYAGEVCLSVGEVRNCYGGEGENQPFIVPVSITNIINDTIYVDIPYGTMLEVQKDNVQNIVVSTSETVKLQPYQTKTVSLKAMCAAQHRSDPAGAQAKLTPFLLDVPKSAYRDKYTLWHHIERYTPPVRKFLLTFYAWDAGTTFDNGQESLFGHAFVEIPGIGLVGYGTNGVADHSRSVHYATKSSSVWITENDLRRVRKKYEAWLNDAREYQLGRHDCTSFVMDMADAAHVRYGTRWLIQYPTQFISSLNFYNNDQRGYEF